MRFISRNAHGVLDYAVGALLIISPWLFEFETNSAAMLVAIALGVAAILYSLITRYEWGLAGLIPFNAHLTIDMMGGFVLALSPWLFGFADVVYLPHLIIGIGEIMASQLTQRELYPHIEFGAHDRQVPPASPSHS